MKVIDVLNNIANNEELPLKIKIKGDIYRQSNGQFWCDENGTYMIDNCASIYHLNDEVEILEEPNGIPEKINCWYNYNGIDDKELTKIMLDELKDKINEILDYLESKGE